MIEMANKIWHLKPYINHLLFGEDDYTKKYYIVAIISVGLVGDNNINDVIKHVKCLCNVIDYSYEDEGMTQEIKLAYLMNEHSLFDCIELFRGNDLGKLLILDGYILSMIMQDNIQPKVEYLISMSKAFGFDDEILNMITNLSVVIVSGDLKKYNCEKINSSTDYDFYLCDFNFSPYRKIIFADKIVEMWLDEQKKIDKWLSDTYGFPEELDPVIYGFVSNLKYVLKKPMEIIFEYKSKSITYFSHFNLSTVHEYIGTPMTLDQYSGTYTYSDLKVWEQVVVLSKRIDLGDICRSRNIKIPRTAEEILNLFQTFPIGVITHCLDYRNNVVDFFAFNGGVPNDEDKWEDYIL